MTDPVLAALHKRRAELTAEIKSLNQQLDTAIQAVEHLDGTIRQFDPSHRGRASLIQKCRRADMVKTVLGMLRTAHGPLSLREITTQIMVSRGLNPDDGKVANRMLEKVRHTLTIQRENGTVISEAQGGDKRLLWRVVG